MEKIIKKKSQAYQKQLTYYSRSKKQGRCGGVGACVCLGLCMTPFSSTNTMIRSSPMCSREKKR